MQRFDDEGPWDRLEELGVSHDLFHEVLDKAAADARACTKFDAPSMKGTTFWSRANRYLAEGLRPQQWLHTPKDSILRVIHPTRSHAITVMSAAGGVGDLTKRVRSKNPKGSEVSKLVEKTGQLVLLSEDVVRFGKELDDIPTWILLYRRSKEIKAELSLPKKMNGKYINEWHERIPLNLPDLGEPGNRAPMVDTPLDTRGDDTEVVVEFRESQ
ncbi:hypothetical protein OOZ19_00800 [Saccharopolyspora sp. NFXS83]|uniref:hypothetical protein n=1 Tax=Saccharopolyspora sp. NFXS83 TaxID=2993560 RepID=UPI00224B263A|nr:hypothetical protein [Saccharopolyspora sp. NFXS83]MCX2728769.1 hypothetical protein [Saccharopolyspora sp. NFXS83]